VLSYISGNFFTNSSGHPGLAAVGVHSKPCLRGYFRSQIRQKLQLLSKKMNIYVIVLERSEWLQSRSEESSFGVNGYILFLPWFYVYVCMYVLCMYICFMNVCMFYVCMYVLRLCTYVQVKNVKWRNPNCGRQNALITNCPYLHILS
jgi:hypothetical protein